MAGDNWQTVEQLQSAGILHVEDGNHGENRPRREEFVSKGVPFIRAADMGGGSVNFRTAEHINPVALARIRKGIGRPGDVLLSHKGTVGKLARVPLDAPPFVCSPQTTFWRVLAEDKLDRGYLYAFMQSALFLSQLKSVQGETDMAPYVSLTAQRRLKVVVPRLSEQVRIADLLGALDDSIDLNQRIIDTLAAIVQTLFKSWFIDFDPVHAKLENHTTRLPKKISALFPGSFHGNGLPEGWTHCPIGQLYEISGGNTPSTESTAFWDGEHPWATPKDLASLPSPVLVRTGRRLTDDGLAQTSSGLLPTGSLLLSSRAPIGYMAFIAEPTAINQGFAGIIRKKTSTAYAWAWCHANMAMIQANAGGSTFPEISKAVFRQLPMLLPTESVLDAFGRTADRLIDRIIGAVRQQSTLSALRDVLLPRLISGDLRIADAEQRIAAA